MNPNEEDVNIIIGNKMEINKNSAIILMFFFISLNKVLPPKTQFYWIYYNIEERYLRII